MSDKHREAFPSVAAISAMADTWAERTGIVEKLKTVPSNLPTEEMQQRHDTLVLRHVKLSYEEGIAAGWQAARDRYAPKLPPLKDVELTNAAQAYGCGTADHLQTFSVIKALEAIGAFGGAPKVTEKAAVEILRQVGYGPKTKVQMLKAAGVRFREEA